MNWCADEPHSAKQVKPEPTTQQAMRSSSLAVVGASALLLVLALVLSQPTVGVEASNSFSGANSYFLWSLSGSGVVPLHNYFFIILFCI
jgi:hypothetical protein